MKRVRILAGMLALCAVLLTGCGKQETTSGTQAAASGDWTITAESLTQEPQFLDRTQDGVKLQLIALKDADGQVRIAYNTCQVCAGSPYAYFEYTDGALECQNCGNRFPLSSVGEAAGGCNPMPVEAYQANADGSVTIPESELTRGTAAFANWKKGL